MTDDSDLCSACADATSCAKEISFTKGGEEFPGCPYGGCPWKALERAEARVGELEGALEKCLAYEVTRAELSGLSDCTCINLSRNAEIEYETSQCPHQLAHQALDRLPGGGDD